MTRYELIEADNKSINATDKKAFNDNCINQSFLCFGGLCCFCESIIEPDDIICEHFARLIIILNYKKAFIEMGNEES